MNISPVGSSLLYNQVQNTKESQQSLASGTMKNALNSPQQYLNLLEQSVSVKNSVQLAQGIGVNVDAIV